MEQVDNVVVEERKDVVQHIIYLLDSSKGMFEPVNKHKAAIDRINEELRQLPAGYILSVYEFGEEAKWRRKKRTSYEPLGYRKKHMGESSLNDSIYPILKQITKFKNKATIKIITNGKDECSYVTTNDDIREVIAQLRKQGHSVSFIGTEEDVNISLKNYGVSIK